MHHPQVLSLLLLRVKEFIFLCIAISLVCCKPSPDLPLGDPDKGGLFVPGNFEVVVVADSVGRARHLVVNDNGDIYVKLSSSDSIRGGNIALGDTTHDGKADIIQRFGGVDARRTSYGTGMTIHEDYLYFSSATVLYRYKLTPGKLIPEGQPEVVLTDDHAHGIHWHITKPVAFDNQGYMYVPFGAPSNACQDLSATPNGAPGGEGLDPCPELEEHGGIWRFDANKTGLTQGIKILAKGVAVYPTYPLLSNSPRILVIQSFIELRFSGSLEIFIDALSASSSISSNDLLLINLKSLLLLEA